MRPPLEHVVGEHHVMWFRICRGLTILLLVGIIWDPVPGLLPAVMKNNLAVIVVLAALLSVTVTLSYDFLTRTQRDWEQLIGKYFFLMTSIILLFGMFYIVVETHFTDSGLRSLYTYTPERDAFYFSAITYFTVGYGDYVPFGAAKTLSVFEAALGNIVNLVVLAIALTRVTGRPETKDKQTVLKKNHLHQ